MESGEKNSEQSDLAKDARINQSNDSFDSLKHESIPESQPIPTSFLVETLESICTKKLKNMFNHNHVRQQNFTLKHDDSDKLKTFINEEPSSEVIFLELVHLF